MYFDPLYMFIVIAFALFSMYISRKLKQKIQYYSNKHLENNMSGLEVAQKMLADYGISDVSITCTSGKLTDHYDPLKKTVNLSESVYNDRSVAAAAIAAHECGHALQHASGYEWLQLRSRLVPVVSISSNLSQWLIFGGMLLMYSFSFGYAIAVFGLLLYGLTTLFTFVTLPVEYDASNRAMNWLKSRQIVTQEEYLGVEDALKWAARTYLVAALGALATLIYFALRILSRD